MNQLINTVSTTNRHSYCNELSCKTSKSKVYQSRAEIRMIIKNLCLLVCFCQECFFIAPVGEHGKEVGLNQLFKTNFSTWLNSCHQIPLLWRQVHLRWGVHLCDRVLHVHVSASLRCLLRSLQVKTSLSDWVKPAWRHTRVTGCLKTSSGSASTPEIYWRQPDW